LLLLVRRFGPTTEKSARLIESTGCDAPMVALGPRQAAASIGVGGDLVTHDIARADWARAWRAAASSVMFVDFMVAAFR
jgi:hypothetical protein